MAKKKRGTAKGEKAARLETRSPSAGRLPSSSPSSRSPVRFAPWERVGLPALGALALVAGWVAALGGFSDGTLSVLWIFELDTLRPWLVFYDMFLSDYPVTGWRHAVSPYYFPDLAMAGAAYAVTPDFRAGTFLCALLMPAFAAGGWILVCDRLFGKSPVRRAAVLLLHAAPLLILAWRGPDLFVIQTMLTSRYGVWAFLPWLLWLLMRTLDAGDNGGDKRGAKTTPLHPKKLAAAGGLLFGLVWALASDLTFLPWLVAPAGFALLCLVFLKRMRVGEFALFVVVLALASPLGRALHRGFGFAENRNTDWRTSFNPERSLQGLSDLGGAVVYAASRNPVEALVWIVFVVFAVWHGFAALRPSRALARWLDAPRLRSHLFVALFVPLSAAGALGAVALTGNAVPREWWDGAGLNTALRYVLPALYFPLFAGWALLPWRAGLFRVRPAVVVCALSVAAVLIAAPKAAAVRGDALDPFNTAFHQCFNDAAKRLGWRGGIGSVGFTHPLTADPGNDVEKMTPAGILRRGAGQSRFYLDWTVFNRHHFNGEFEFVVVNGFGGRALGAFPRAGVRGCELSDLGSCEPPQPAALILDEGSVRAAFGDPAEVVDCEGMGLYHYDPPIALDFSGTENPDFAQVGRGW